MRALMTVAKRTALGAALRFGGAQGVGLVAAGPGAVIHETPERMR